MSHPVGRTLSCLPFYGGEDRLLEECLQTLALKGDHLLVPDLGWVQGFASLLYKCKLTLVSDWGLSAASRMMEVGFSVDQLKGKQPSPMFQPEALVVFRANGIICFPLSWSTENPYTYMYMYNYIVDNVYCNVQYKFT